MKRPWHPSGMLIIEVLGLFVSITACVGTYLR